MSTSPHDAVAAAPAGNPGETLRRAREAAGWSLENVATELNLTVYALQQLEAGAFERLPGHTFARGYVRAYARLLGLDPARLAEAFDRYTGTDARGSTVQSLGRIREPLRLSRNVLRLATAGLLLLLLILLGFFWWQERPQPFGELGALSLQHIEVDSAEGVTQIHPVEEPASALPSPSETRTALPDTTTEVLPEAASAPVTRPEAAVPLALPAAPTSVAPAVQPPAVPEQPRLSAAETATAPPPAASEPPLAAGEGQIALAFTADCWTQVTDGHGRVLLSTVKRAGETLQISGRTPLELRLGNARGARDVRYNGELVEHLKNMTASGTVRLKLGQ
ncbi:RodZ family helix-turn-helix domain-containing protein [Pseudomonas sp. NW5]|uniref:helix-turn-helix domain-containing protein n=1 Tax=Pseudomonas sp. NW5 TaxID=2934934 RepID=UPI0020205A6D|nr:RodZ family helix-turn-helix domain-containing protein [Pseudomonas sp. NW5]MCL7462479.1 helix-turn-helix domain-containing protein [Pseudomonas sp. NW5]